MSIQYFDEGDNFRSISLSGRLDNAGADEISTQFAVLAASSGRRVLVDLASVTFLSSIGIRLLVQNAKAAHSRGGRLVVFVGENEQVGKTLESTGISGMIPMFSDLEAAKQAVLN